MYRDQDNGWFSEIYLDTDKRQNTIYFDEKIKPKINNLNCINLPTYICSHMYTEGEGGGMDKIK